YNIYKEETLEYLLEDPYVFVYDIDGFNFKVADRIGQLYNISLNHSNSVGAAIINVLDESVQSGHVYLLKSKVINNAFIILNTTEVKEYLIKEILLILNEKKKIKIKKDNDIYLITLYYAEDGFSSHLKRIMSVPIDEEVPTADLLKIAGEVEESDVISY